MVRFSGGPQAAHNVVTPGGRHHTFSQFGSGTFVPAARTLLSRFVLIEPYALFNEAAHLESLGLCDVWGRLLIDALPGDHAAAPSRQPPARARPRPRRPRHLRRRRRRNRPGPARRPRARPRRPRVGRPPDHRPKAARPVRPEGGPTPWRHHLATVPPRRPLESRHATPADVGRGRGGQLCGAGVPRVGDRRARRPGDPPRPRHPSVRGRARRAAGRVVRLPPPHHLEHHDVRQRQRAVGRGGLCRPADAPGRAAHLLHPPRPRPVRYGVRQGGRRPARPPPTPRLPHLPEPHNDDRGWQGRFRTGWFDAVAARYALAVAGPVDGLALTHLDRLPALGYRLCRASRSTRGPAPATSTAATTASCATTVGSPAYACADPPTSITRRGSAGCSAAADRPRPSRRAPTKGNSWPRSNGSSAHRSC